MLKPRFGLFRYGSKIAQTLVFAAVFGVASQAQRVTVAAAGDIACSPASDPHYNGGAGDKTHCQMKATSDLILERAVDAVLTLGDNQYATGRLTAFEQSFGPTWGRFKELIYPVPGNHEYLTTQGTGYYAYFGDAARDPEKGYYSFDLGAWHLIALNSNCKSVGGCGEGSEQLKWLQDDLATHGHKCILAYWHHPRFSSGKHGDNAAYQDFWNTLAKSGAELVLSGHEHNYERFGPQGPDGSKTGEGLRQFVIGTGGVNLRSVGDAQANSEVVVTDTFGVLFLTLEASSYSWSFVAASGESLDSGTASCH